MEKAKIVSITLKPQIIAEGKLAAGGMPLSRFIARLLHRESQRGLPIASRTNAPLGAPDDNNIEIIIEIPRHMASRMDELAQRLGLSVEQVALSAIGSATSEMYLSKLAKLADDIEGTRRRARRN